MKYIDTHAHLISTYFNSDPDEAVLLAKKNNVDKIILPGTTVDDSLNNIKFSKIHNNVYAMAGIHPADSLRYDIDYLNSIDPNDIVAIGEIGLDFYHDDNPSIEVQQKCFITHLEYAIKHNKPVVIHMRDSEKEMYDILEKYSKKGLKLLLHSYSSNLEWAKKFIKIGVHISFSGIVTFKNAKNVQEVAKMVPSNLIIAETDSPFLTPTPHRGKPNQPMYVKDVVNFICKLRNDNTLADVIYQNSINFFGL